MRCVCVVLCCASLYSFWEGAGGPWARVGRRSWMVSTCDSAGLESVVATAPCFSLSTCNQKYWIGGGYRLYDRVVCVDLVIIDRFGPSRSAGGRACSSQIALLSARRKSGEEQEEAACSCRSGGCVCLSLGVCCLPVCVSVCPVLRQYV